MEPDKPTQKLIEMIKKLMRGTHSFDGWYSMPYSSSDDDKVDFIIKYKIEKISIWKSKENDCPFEGTIYIEPLSLSLGVNDDWEHGFLQHDIYEWIWDELAEDCVHRIMSHIPIVCLDSDFNFDTLNKKTP